MTASLVAGSTGVARPKAWSESKAKTQSARATLKVKIVAPPSERMCALLLLLPVRYEWPSLLVEGVLRAMLSTVEMANASIEIPAT